MSNVKTKIAIVSLCFVLIGITYLSLKSVSQLTLLRVNDKVGHFIAYAVLSLNALIVRRPTLIKTNIALAMVLIGYGILMELLQSFVPGREVSGFDVIANSTGVGIGFLLFNRLKRYL
jgi:VanZ family protein